MTTAERDGDGPTMSRRRLLQAGVAAGAALVLPPWPAAHATASTSEDFTGLGDGWGDAWQIDGVANLLVDDDRGLLQAATDIYPADERAVAFLVDERAQDAEITAIMTATGLASGVVLRRTAPRTAYLTLYSMETRTLQIVAKTPEGESVVAAGATPALRAPVTLRMRAAGTSPTSLVATVEDADGNVHAVEGSDETPALQRPGDPGLVATCDTGFPSGPDTPPIIGSSRAVVVTDAGDDVEDSPVGGLKNEVYRQVSTAVYEEVTVTSAGQPATTAPSVVAAVTGMPRGRGARVSVVSDVPARIDLQVARRPDFADARTVPGGDTNRFRTLLGSFADDAAGEDREVFWRAVLRRGEERTVGPVRRFRSLPPAGDGADFTLAVGGCGTEFKGVHGNVFDLVADLDPDVFAWIGDLNYPDSHGSLAQTMSGYEGIWQQFLAAPPLIPIFERSAFVPQRDDHDYGRNDLSADSIPAFGKEPWDHIMAPEPYSSFEGGLGAVWVLDDRRFKDPQDEPDTEDKSLVGTQQRRWLFDGLAESSAPFKIVLSPNPVWLPTNNETCWGRDYTAERVLLLEHIDANVSGSVLFVTADSHAAAVIERDGFVEMRPCPISLPAPPGWHDAASGEGVLFSEQGEAYVALLEIGAGDDGTPTLHARLLRGDGSTAWERRMVSAGDGGLGDGAAAGPGRGDRDSAGAGGGAGGAGGALPATGAGAAGAGATALGAAAILGRRGVGEQRDQDDDAPPRTPPIYPRIRW